MARDLEGKANPAAQPSLFLLAVLLRVWQTNANRQDELQSASAPPFVEC